MSKQFKGITHSYDQDLPEDFTHIEKYDWEFTVTEPSLFRASGHIDCHHRGVYGTEDKAVMVSLNLKFNGRWLEGSKTGCNIVGTEQHYAILPIHGDKVIEPGTHKVEVWMRSASTAASGKNGLAEIKASYDRVFYEVESL